MNDVLVRHKYWIKYAIPLSNVIGHFTTDHWVEQVIWNTNNRSTSRIDVWRAEQMYLLLACGAIVPTIDQQQIVTEDTDLKMG